MNLSICRSRGTMNLGYDSTAFDVQTGIEPTFVLCLGKNVEKAIPRKGRGEWGVEVSQRIVNKWFTMYGGV